MKKYKKLVKKILSKGIEQKGRNGLQLIIPSYSFSLNFSKKTSHILKLRKMYYRGVEGEFKTLIDPTPLTNISQFEKNGCNYWKLWGTPAGDINIDYHNMMHPQLENLIKEIKINPHSRRLHLELWNHKNLNLVSLPCCWHGITFSVLNNTLHMKWTQRSVDTLIGLPSDIYLAKLFMAYVAAEGDFKQGTCMFSLSNVHIYKEHIEGAKELLKRTPKDFNKPLQFKLKS